LKGVGKIFSKIFLTGGVGATPPRNQKTEINCLDIWGKEHTTTPPAHNQMTEINFLIFRGKEWLLVHALTRI
jgi:hypothetical protein